MHLHRVENLGAKDEELIPFVLIEGVDYETLPENVNLLLLQSFAIGAYGQEFKEIKTPCHFLNEIQDLNHNHKYPHRDKIR